MMPKKERNNVNTAIPEVKHVIDEKSLMNRIDISIFGKNIFQHEYQDLYCRDRFGRA
jgi:hypothetical protein